MSDWDMGPYICQDQHHALLHHVLENEIGGHPLGLALEFGTGSGKSARCISRYLPLITFDSFQGLPEDWREGFPKGSFRYDPPELPKNCKVVQSAFEDLTLADFSGTGPLRLVHLDADLYSSTYTALTAIPYVLKGAILVFDEFWNYPGCENHEQLAFARFIDLEGLDYEVIGHGEQSWAVKIK